MFQRPTSPFSTPHLFVLLLLLSAILQPAHTTNHRLQTTLSHAGEPLLLIGDISAYSVFTEHRENHDKELCGQCQFGFMGDGVQSAFSFAASFVDAGYKTAQTDLPPQSTRIFIRNRGPPLSC